MEEQPTFDGDPIAVAIAIELGREEVLLKLWSLLSAKFNSGNFSSLATDEKDLESGIPSATSTNPSSSKN